MKKIRNIVLLSGLLLVLVFTWLIPKTKGEKKTQYVRVYSEEREIAVDEDSSKMDKAPRTKQKDDLKKKEGKKTEKKRTKKERVVIKTDTLNGNFRVKDIELSMYSRSMHFRPKKYVEMTVEDIPKDSNSVKADTLKKAMF